MKNRIGIICVLILSAIPVPAPSVAALSGNDHAADSASGLDLIGQIGGDNHAIAVQDKYAYLGVGPRVVVMDVSDPAHPVAVGQTEVLPNIVDDISISGSYVYAADGQLQIFNIADPAHPAPAGTFSNLYTAEGVTVSGSYAYVAASDKGLSIINISDPVQPALVGSCDMPGDAESVAVAGTYAYVAGGEGGLVVIDISNPAQPVEVASYAGYASSPSASGVAVSGSIVYLMDGNAGLRIIDVTDPHHPHEVGSQDVGPSNEPDKVAILNSTAYTTGSGLNIIDVTTPSSPHLLGHYPIGTVAKDVAIAGSLAYVADGTGMRIIDSSNAATPREVGAYKLPGYIDDVTIAGDNAYLVDGLFGLFVVSLKDPSHPAVISALEDFGSRSVTVSGSYAYFSHEGNLGLFDISDPAHPVQKGSFNLSDVNQVLISGAYAFIANGGDGLFIFDISDPMKPKLVGSIDTPSDAHRVFLSGTYAYIADEEGGLRIINAADPAHPVEAGSFSGNDLQTSYQTTDRIFDVFVSGSLAYLGADNDLIILDISNPAHPRKVGSLPSSMDVMGVAVSGSRAFLSTGSEMLALDVSDPSQPVQTGSYFMGSGGGVTLSGSNILFARGDAGLFIMRAADQTQGAGTSAAPSNPLNLLPGLAGATSTPAPYAPQPISSGLPANTTTILIILGLCFLGIAALVLAAGGIWLIRRKRKTQTGPPARPEENKTRFSATETYANRSVGFRFQYPQGWRQTFRAGALILNPPGDNVDFLAVTMLTGTSNINHSMSPLQLAEQFIRLQPNNFRNYKLLWKRSIKLSSGHPGIEYSFDFADPHGPFRSLGVVAVRRGKQEDLFSLDVSGVRSAIQSEEAQFKKIMESLSLD